MVQVQLLILVEWRSVKFCHIIQQHSNSTSTMSLRPITRKLPYSRALWEESYVPLCAVFSPMEEIEDHDNNKTDDTPDTFAQPIATIPKCLYCGAPHPTSTTHYRFGDKILCYLCGEVSSILIADQQEVRTDEYLDPELYNKIPFLSPAEARKKNKTESDDEDDDIDDVYDFSTDTIEFRIPITQQTAQDADRQNGRKSQQKAPLATWQLPAMTCPPVWWIIVDGSVGNSNSIGATRNYWATVGATLRNALKEVPPHVHIGLLTATGSRLASWDLTSAVPHVQQYPYSYDPAAMEKVEGIGEGHTNGKNKAAVEIKSEPWDFCLVPANGHYKANLEAAIRAMVDGGMSGIFLEDSCDNGEEKKSEDDRNSQFVPLGLTLEILLEFMEQAVHPGQDEEDTDGEGDGNDRIPKLKYAGGKILCLLGNPTLETGKPSKDDCMSYMGQPNFGFGGLAGACRSVDGFNNDSDVEGKNLSRKTRRNKLRSKDDSSNTSKENSNESKTDPTDLTASNLKDYAIPLEPDDLFVNIGSQCAKAALGVDLIVLVPEEDEGVSGSQKIPWFGLPLLRPLSDASGAPGPLMFGTGNIGSFEESDEDAEVDNKYNEKFERLFENVLARTPWQSGMVFGAQMKVRLSPGLKLENSPLGGTGDGSIQLAKLLTSGGICGPTVLVTGDEDEADVGAVSGGGDKDDDEIENLWVMGSCDPHTSFTIDLDIDGEEDIPDECELEGFGSVPLKPVIQICTLYTCVETDGAEPTPNYYTVCKIRVSSVALDLADDMESILNGLDPEAMSVALFNKIVLDAYLEGFKSAQKSAESWLIATMVSVYESALDEKARLEEDPEGESNPYFVASNRLLDESGAKLDETEILLGEGHFKTRFFPLLTYAIMQCDALRPCGRVFKPSMDARLCAITQMSSMTPKASAKTFAPSLSLWSLKNDNTILDSLPLSREGILEQIKDLGEEDIQDSVFLLESSQNVILFTVDDLENMDSKPKKDFTGDRPYNIGADLDATISDSLAAYRTAPPQLKVFERTFVNNGTGDLNDFKVTPSLLRSMLVEDMPDFDGNKNFEDWKFKMAQSIIKELDSKKPDNTKSQTGLSRFFFRR